MAKGGMWQRLGNLWRGFVSLWIADVEKAHPEIAYENAISSMTEKYIQLRRATAAIIRRREEVEQRLLAASRELKQVEADLATAVESDQQDLGIVLVQKQKMLTAQVTELQAESRSAVADADSAKSALLQVHAEIKKLRSEKEDMLAKMHSAQVKVRIQEQLEGLSVDAEVKALDNVRQHIKSSIAEANLGAELGQSTLDARLKALRAKTGEVTAKGEWERLRAASAAKAGQKTGQ